VSPPRFSRFLTVSDAQHPEEQIMATLRVLNGSGDRQITWSTQGLAEGDAEAQAAVREAERIFVRERELGGTAFHVRRGVPAERIDAFDPRAEETVVIAPMVGG
jgi:hypothetical protein